MEFLHSLLKFALNMGASDIHIKADHHVTIRVAAELHPVQEMIPTAEQVTAMVQHMIPQHLQMRLEREREADFSYYAESVGRYRVNVYHQRGNPCLALRYVKEHIPSIAELHLPDQIRSDRKSTRLNSSHSQQSRMPSSA